MGVEELEKITAHYLINRRLTPLLIVVFCSGGFSDGSHSNKSSSIVSHVRLSGELKPTEDGRSPEITNSRVNNRIFIAITYVDKLHKYHPRILINSILI